MYIIFLSACQKRAARRSRALLDSYALRAGERCWMSPMTAEGLREIRTALSRTATRQTAVACYQNDGRRRMKLLWIVGARGRFGRAGHFPAGHRRVVSPAETPRWLRHAGLVVRLAGLLHDLGKYSQKFQKKLRGKADRIDFVRHEWLSLKLWQVLRPDVNWKTAWKGLPRGEQLTQCVVGDREICNASHYGIASAQECVDALIATHHGLFSEQLPSPKGRLVREGIFFAPNDGLFIDWSEPEFSFLETVRRLEGRLAATAGMLTGEAWTQYWRGLFWYARAALVFADHTISALEYPASDDDQAFANTCSAPQGSRLNQRLSEHMLRVSERAAETVWRMAQLAEHPEASLDGLQPCACEAVLRPALPDSRFAWQNTAAEALAAAREAHPESGVLLFNMAGTGSGKTRMNVRAACLLSRDTSPRMSIALNLRSLTLQTGEALRIQLGLADSDLATVIGDEVARTLFNTSKLQDPKAQPDSWCDDDGNTAEPETLTAGGVWTLPAWLEAFFPKRQERRILGAPLLVSTIDYLIAAGEPHRQGHHVKALLRLMSADLVLDEVDSYEPKALVAVLRLVQGSAFFGRNVLCSTATLSRPVAQAVEAAYASGVEMRRCLKGVETAHYLRIFIDDLLPPRTDAVSLHVDDTEQDTGLAVYDQRVAEHMAALEKLPVCRYAEIRELSKLPNPSVAAWLQGVTESVQELHDRHGIRDARSGVKYSFGLVRVANIATAVDTARHLARALPNARVACYHAGDWRMARAYKERRLDTLLSRAAGEKHITEDAEIRAVLDEEGRTDAPFIVVATPVEEVGRDHDFDWAVVDVSSTQSLVQAAGRVNRHRLHPCSMPNIMVPQFNWRHCRNEDRGCSRAPAFRWPGYEEEGRERRYKPHDLSELLPWQDNRLAVTAKLRLDTSCTLACKDNTAIERTLSGYFGTAACGEAYFTSKPVSAALLSEKIYADTPLRDRAGRPETWRLGYDAERLEDVYEVYERQGVQRKAKGVWKACDSRRFRVVEALPNAWLWLDAEAMRERCVAVGLTEEQALAVELVGYDEASVWEYDKGFGISRRSAAE